MIANEVLRSAVLRLTAAGIPDASRDARALLAYVARIALERLTLHLQDSLLPEVMARFDEVVTRRVNREPVSHITGQRLFWGRSFCVTADTLDPRPETELLVQTALSVPFVRVLDLGTGTGCILLSLLADRPTATGTGTDIHQVTLTVAQKNAVTHGLVSRARFILSDWFSSVTGRFDLIVSNPPYIAESEMSSLSPEVLREPRCALTPGGDGLDPYRQIAAKASAYLAPQGRLIVEIGPTQGSAVASFFANAGFSDIHKLQDLDGRDRVVVARAL